MRHFFMSVAGESFRNDDGTNRQAIISRCRVGDPMRLEHEPTNPHDENAIRVLRWNGEQVGYLPAEAAAKVVEDNTHGATYHAIVALVGREHRRRPYGIALLVVSDHGPMDANAAQTYAVRVLSEERGLQVPKYVGGVEAHADARASQTAIGIVIVALVLGVVFIFARAAL